MSDKHKTPTKGPSTTVDEEITEDDLDQVEGGLSHHKTLRAIRESPIGYESPVSLDAKITPIGYAVRTSRDTSSS